MDKNNKSTNTEGYSNTLNKALSCTKSIDSKSGILLSVNSFIFAAISFMNKKLDLWAFATIITLLIIGVILLLIAIVPIFWNWHEDKDNPLYIPNIWHKKENELSFTNTKPNKNHYESQIKRVASIYRFKLAFQITSSILLATALLVLIIDVLIISI